MAPIALTIAGSDSGGGAGLQADLKTMSALGVYGASIVTAVTAQNTRAVTAVHAIPMDVVTAQIETVLNDLDVRAIKIGMLATSEIIETVADALDAFSGPIVLDPVMVAKSGDTLLSFDAISTLKRRLLPRCTVLTPNLPEAAQLLGTPQADTQEDMEVQGQRLCDLGAAAVLMKGGHGTGQSCHDLLVKSGGPSLTLSAARQTTTNTHGTGCTLSSAIAAGLAKGQDLNEAVQTAHGYLQKAISAADTLSIGSGHGPVHHFHAMWSE